MFSRVENWQQLLGDYLDASSTRPFKWGTFDCATFTGDCVELQTNVDVLCDKRGRYGGSRGALLTYRLIGANSRSMIDVMIELFGSPISVAYAKRGDPIIVRSNYDDAFPFSAGIVDLSGRNIATVTDVGLIRMSIDDAVCAWGLE